MGFFLLEEGGKRDGLMVGLCGDALMRRRAEERKGEERESWKDLIGKEGVNRVAKGEERGTY